MSAKTRIWIILTFALCAGIVAVGIFGGFAAGLMTSSITFRTVDSTQERNEAMRAEIKVLQETEANLVEAKRTHDQLVSAVPQTVDTAGLLAELQQIQAASGARLVSLSVRGAEPGSAPANESTVDSVADEVGESGVAVEGSGTEQADAASAPAIATISVSIQLAGTQQQVAEFIRGLQTGKRLYVANEVEISGLGDDATATVLGEIFMIVDR